MINTEIPEKREANGAEPEIYMHRTNRMQITFKDLFLRKTKFEISSIFSTFLLILL